jgi:hypothetical protein
VLDPPQFSGVKRMGKLEGGEHEEHECRLKAEFSINQSKE